MDERFDVKVNKAFEEFLDAPHQSFLLETINREKIFNFFKEKLSLPSSSFERGQNQENYFLKLKLFDVEKARDVIQYGKVGFEEMHFIVISFYSAGREAQNAILKFLEEVPENLKIIFITHAGANIIKTIKSRVYKIDFIDEESLEGDAEEEYFKFVAEKFLTTKRLLRSKIKEISEILERKDEYALENEDKERLDRESLEKLLLAIYKNVLEEYNIEMKNKKDKESEAENKMEEYKRKELLAALEEIGEYIKYAKNNSSSGKTMIDYLALRLPELSLAE